MLIANDRGMGMTLNLPDVDKFPPVGIPAPLVALGFNAQSLPFSLNVHLCAVPATNQATKKMMTSGNEAGLMGGVMSGIVKGPGGTVLGNFVVFVNGLPGENLLCPTNGNNFNAMAGTQVVPSANNVLYTYRAAALDTAGLSEQPPAPDVRPGGADAKANRLDRDALSLLRQAVDDPTDDRAVVSAELLDGDTAHVVLRRMSAAVDRRIRHELRRLGASRVRGIILDLRDNPGGDATAALDLADDFLPKGTPLAERVEPDGDVDVLYARRARCCRLPLVVLVDGGTASAAELLAGCLQHHGRARLVGEPTYGKATACRIVRLQSGEPALAHAATFWLPGCARLHGAGLQPDLAVPAAATDEPGDPALATARRALLAAAGLSGGSGGRGVARTEDP